MPKSLHHQFVDKANKGDLFPLETLNPSKDLYPWTIIRVGLLVYLDLLHQMMPRQQSISITP
jgi:hypothetical protein